MHDVDRHAGRVRDHNGAVGRFALDFRRTRIRMGLRAGQAFVHVFFLQGRDDVAILGMNQRQRAKGRAALERGEHLVVVYHQRAFVGHEVLKGVDAALDHLRHFIEMLLGPAVDAHMQRIIGRSLTLRFPLPVVKRSKHAVRARNDEIDNQCRSA
jgi:hypothetical protein